MKRVIVNREFVGPVVVKTEDEQIVCNRGARVILCEGTNLIVEIIAKTEKQKGADGVLHDAIIFVFSYPSALSRESRKGASDDQKESEG